MNDAHLVGVEILLEPFGTEHLRAFVDRVRLSLEPLRASLTPAERQIVELGRQGLARKEIADELGISENTVKTHTKRLLQKTGDSSLAVLATRMSARRY